MAGSVDARPSFNSLIQAQWADGKFLCVGLDADINKLPHTFSSKPRRPAQYEFIMDRVDRTAEYASAFKPNIAFFEDSEDGQIALEVGINYIRTKYPDIPVILDAKRADIGNTMNGYKRMIERYDVHAMTLNTQYFGGDSLTPLEDMPETGWILMAKTSNAGSADLQNMPIEKIEAFDEGLLSRNEFEELDYILDGENPRMHEMAAYLAAKRWNKNGNLGLVVGATHPEAFLRTRRLVGDIPFLIPGIGTQGGDLEKTLQFAPDSNGQGMIINSSSGIIFAEDPGLAAKHLHDQITALRTR